MRISDVQKEIIEEFNILGSIEDKLEFIMELGEDMLSLNDIFKNSINKVSGCLSTVWIRCVNKNGKLYFEGDSNTAITKGLLCLLIRIYSGRKPIDILNCELYFIEQIGPSNMLGAQRIGGYQHMINKIHDYAFKGLNK